MEHSMSMKLNLSSSSPRVSSFPASLHTKHTAVCGRTGYNGLKTLRLKSNSILPVAVLKRAVLLHMFWMSLGPLIIQNVSLNKMYKLEMIYRNALPHNAGLLHSPRPSELLHVPAEVTFAALVPEARFTLATAGPPAPGSRRAAARGHLNSWRGRPNLGLWPVGHPLLKTRKEKLGASFYLQRENLFLWLRLACCSSLCRSSHTFSTGYFCHLRWNNLNLDCFNKCTITSICHTAHLFQPLPCCHGRFPRMKIRQIITLATCCPCWNVLWSISKWDCSCTVVHAIQIVEMEQHIPGIWQYSEVHYYIRQEISSESHQKSF